MVFRFFCFSKNFTFSLVDAHSAMRNSALLLRSRGRTRVELASFNADRVSPRPPPTRAIINPTRRRYEGNFLFSRRARINISRPRLSLSLSPSFSSSNSARTGPLTSVTRVYHPSWNVGTNRSVYISSRGLIARYNVLVGGKDANSRAHASRDRVNLFGLIFFFFTLADFSPVEISETSGSGL